MRHVPRGRQLRAVLAITDQAASVGGITRANFVSRRLRKALLFCLVAAVAVLASTTSASASISPSSGTLTPTNPISFSGEIEPDPTLGVVVENPFPPFIGCASGTEQFCEFFQFTVSGLTGAGTVTFTFRSTNPNNQLDADVVCNNEAFPRASASTTPENPEVTVTFIVAQGDNCTIKISAFSVEDPMVAAGFSGDLALTAGTVAQGGKVSGGGHLLTPDTSFTSNAQDKSSSSKTPKGTIRYVNKLIGCEFHSTSITKVTFTTLTDNGVTVKRADIEGFGRTNKGPETSFKAQAEDRGKPGAGNDRFGIDKCEMPPPQPISAGEITIKLQ